MLCYTQNLPIALQNQPLYTRPRLSGFLTRSSDQSESSQVKQIGRSIFLPSSLLPALCVGNVGKAYPRPLLHVYLVHMHLYIVQQFIILSENVEKASPFLSGTSLHKLFNTNVIQNCTIFQRSRDSRLPLHSSRESCDGLYL